MHRGSQQLFCFFNFARPRPYFCVLCLTLAIFCIKIRKFDWPRSKFHTPAHIWTTLGIFLFKYFTGSLKTFYVNWKVDLWEELRHNTTTFFCKRQTDTLNINERMARYYTKISDQMQHGHTNIFLKQSNIFQLLKSKTRWRYFRVYSTEIVCFNTFSNDVHQTRWNFFLDFCQAICSRVYSCFWYFLPVTGCLLALVFNYGFKSWFRYFWNCLLRAQLFEFTLYMIMCFKYIIYFLIFVSTVSFIKAVIDGNVSLEFVKDIVHYY